MRVRISSVAPTQHRGGTVYTSVLETDAARIKGSTPFDATNFSSLRLGGMTNTDHKDRMERYVKVSSP